MNAGLRGLLGLPERNQKSTVVAEDFARDFRVALSGLNQDLRTLAIHDQNHLLGETRNKLIAAYQATGSESAHGKRLLQAAGKVQQKAAKKAAQLMASRWEWIQRETGFDAALDKIAYLEDAGDSRSADFRKLADAILSRVNKYDYSEAATAFDQLMPKLEQSFAALSDGGNGNGLGNSAILMAASGDTSSSRNGSKTSVSSNQGLARTARVKTVKQGHTQYDFGRPITKEQAAQVIFLDGKVPAEARLEQGPGENVWTLRTFDIDGHQATLRKMRGRTETVIPGRPNSDKSTWNPPEPDTIVMEWSDGPGNPSSGPRRRDLNNDLGFKITRKYALDEGQSSTETVKNKYFGKGHGYELAFQKPLKKAEVLDILFAKKNFGTGQVKLLPVPQEPTPLWQLHLIGVDAIEALKKPAKDAISDAAVYLNDSVEPSVPAGIREHIRDKTVAKNARHHSPNIYVWEQEGFIIRVETDGGKYYQYETTRIDHGDEAGKITIRYFMIDQGMKSREAWQEFITHWEWIHQQIVTGLAMALASGKLPGRAPTTKTSVPPRRVPTRTNPRGQTPSSGGAEPVSPGQTPTVKAPPAAAVNQVVNEVEVIAAFKRDPSSINYTMSSGAHSEVWANLGNTGPAPVAFRVGDKIRVDVQRWPQNKLGDIGIKMRTTPVTTTRQGGTGPKIPDVELANTQPGPAPVNPRAKTNPGGPPPSQTPAGQSPARQSSARTGGSTGSSTGQSTGGNANRASGGPQGLEVSLERVQKMGAVGGDVFPSVSSESHQQAWKSLGHSTEAPVAYIVDKQVYVDMARWPKNMTPPTFRYPRGGRKVNPAKAGGN